MHLASVVVDTVAMHVASAVAEATLAEALACLKAADTMHLASVVVDNVAMHFASVAADAAPAEALALLRLLLLPFARIVPVSMAAQTQLLPTMVPAVAGPTMVPAVAGYMVTFHMIWSPNVS